MSLHGARTPGQGHPGFDRRIVVPQPLRKAPKHPQRTWRRALQPGIELRPLALADERDNVCRQGAGVRQCARLSAPLGELLGLDRRALVLPAQHQPRRPAGREQRWRGVTDRQHALAHQALAGGCPLGLTQTLGIAGDGGITAAVATWAALRTQRAGVTAARIPALDQGVLVGSEETFAAIIAPGPFRTCRRLEVAVHRGAAQAQLPGEGLARPPLAAQRPHLLLEGQPSRPALGSELLGRWRGGWRWDGNGHGALGLADRGLTHRLVDRREPRAMGTAHLLQGLGHMLPQVQAVRDRGRRGGALTGAVRIGLRAIPGHDLDPRMGAQPWGESAGGTSGEEGHGVVPLHIDADRPRRLPFPVRPSIHPEDGGGGMYRQRQSAYHTQEGVSADCSTQTLASLRPRRPAAGHRDLR